MEVVDDDVEVSVEIVVDERRGSRVSCEVGAARRRTILQPSFLVDEEDVRLLVVHAEHDGLVPLGGLHVEGRIVELVLVETIHAVEIVVTVLVEIEEVRVPRPARIGAVDLFGQCVALESPVLRIGFEEVIRCKDPHRCELLLAELHPRVFGRQDVLFILDQGQNVRDVDLGEPVAIEIGGSDIHRARRQIGSQLPGNVGERSIAIVPIPGVDAEVVSDDEVLPAVGVEVDGGHGLGPAGVLRAGSGGDVRELEAPLVPEQLVRRRVRVDAREVRSDSVDVVAVVRQVDVEQAVTIEVEDGRRGTDESLPSEPRFVRDVGEAPVTVAPVKAVIGVHVGDQDVLVAIVVEVGDDWLAWLARLSVLTEEVDPRLLRDFLEGAVAIVEVQAVAEPADEEHVIVTVTVDVVRRDARSREGRGSVMSGFALPGVGCIGGVDRIEERADEATEPVRGAVDVVDSDRGGDIVEETARGRDRPDMRRGDGLAGSGRGRCLDLLAHQCSDAVLSFEDVLRRKELFTLLLRDHPCHAEDEDADLRDSFGEVLCREWIEILFEREVGTVDHLPDQLEVKAAVAE